MEFLKYYMFYFPFFIILTYFLLKYMDNKTNEERMKILKFIAFIGLLLHISKPIFFPYNGKILIDGTNNPDIFNYPGILRKITIENVSAATTVLFLPALILKNKSILDYFIIIGFIGGFLAIIYPAEVIFNTFDSIPIDLNNYKKSLFTFDTIRFYVVHYIPLILSFSLLYYKIHVLDTKRMFMFPIIILAILLILYLNEYMVYKLGWLDDIENYLVQNGVLSKGELFYDRNYRNFSFIYGIPDNFKDIGILIDILVPKFMKEPDYIPVFWITLPAFIYGPLLYKGFARVFEKVTYVETVKEVKEYV